MNYLSHYYFYGKKDNPYYNCGLIFPDWLATYKRARFHHEIKAEKEWEVHLKLGIENHYLGDKTFHGSEYFTKYAHGIKLILERTSLDKDKFRFSFLAHVILEMMIDRILLLKNPAFGEEFYAQLDACDDLLLLQFAQQNSSVDEGLLKLIQKFKYHKFLLHYIKTDNFVYSLNRIAGRVDIVINEQDGKELMNQMESVEKYVEDSMPELFSLFATHEK